MARYYSPPGTFEAILKSVLEDPMLTNAEFRLLLYAATKRPGWVLHVGQLAAALERSDYEVEKAMKGLRRAGYVQQRWARDEAGRFTRWENVLRRDRVVAFVQVTSSGPESASLAATCDDGAKAQVRSTGPDTTRLDTTPLDFDPLANTVEAKTVSSEDGQALSDKDTAARDQTPFDRLDDIADELVSRLGSDCDEERVIRGMLANGAHPRAVENKIVADRRGSSLAVGGPWFLVSEEGL